MSIVSQHQSQTQVTFSEKRCFMMFFSLPWLQALMINQWQDYGALECPPGFPCVAADGEAVLVANGIDVDASHRAARGSNRPGCWMVS